MHHRLAFRRQCRAAGLTDRETDVLVELSEGRSYRQVGSRLGISWHTVRNHMTNARNRTGAATVIELVAFVCFPEDRAA